LSSGYIGILESRLGQKHVYNPYAIIFSIVIPSTALSRGFQRMLRDDETKQVNVNVDVSRG